MRATGNLPVHFFRYVPDSRASRSCLDLDALELFPLVLSRFARLKNPQDANRG